MEFTSYEMVGANTASLNTGSYLNRTEYSLFVKGYTTDLWYGFSARDTMEIGIWDRDQNPLGWDVTHQSKSFNVVTSTYLNALNFPVTYSYSELNPDFILYKNSKILVEPPGEVSSSFGIMSGSYFLTYNFVRDLAGDSDNPLIIKEISPSRKELKLIPLGRSTPSYDAFCQEKVLLQDVSPLYLEATKTCLYDQIYARVNPTYQPEINTIKALFFLKNDGEMVTFLRNLYQDVTIYTAVPVSQDSLEVITGSLIRIQGIQTYFTNYLLSNSSTILDFQELDNKFNGFVSASIERKFAPIGAHPLKPYVDAKAFVYDFFTKHYYQLVSTTLSSTYNEKYFSYLRNGLNVGNNRLLPILNQGLMDERVQANDPLTLLVKLKDELPNDLSIQAHCWISNISLTPYVLSAIIKNPSQMIVHKIGVPNFSLPLPNVSLANTNMTYTAADLSNEPATDRDLTISKNIAELSVDYTDFQKFIVFSSAELRLKIFKNKVINLTSYSSSIQTLNDRNTTYLAASGSTYPFYTQEYDTFQGQITEIVDSFDGYESYLYQSGDYAYANGQFISASYVAEMDVSASAYDTTNRDSLINTCPSHILTNSDNDEYIIFLSMIGHFFDQIYEYISSIPSERSLGHSATEEFTRRIVDYMLQTFGWNLDDSLEQASLLNNYLTAEQMDGLNSMSAEERLKSIRNRVLINLPQIYKTKGTEESIRLVLACYGIPSSLLSIREFGGVNYTDDRASYTTYERSYMYMHTTSSVMYSDTFYNNLTTDAKTYLYKVCLDDATLYPHDAEITYMGVVSSSVASTSTEGSGEWATGFVRRKGPNMGQFWFRIGTKSNPLLSVYSPEFPLFDGSVYSVMIRRNLPHDGYEFDANTDAIPCNFDLYVQKNEFGRQILRLTASKMSYEYASNHRFSTSASGSYLVRGGWFDYWNGQGLHGAFDKLQVWFDPVSDSNWEDYVNSINSYAFSGSHPAYQSLLFRQHTDYPFDLRQTTGSLGFLANNKWKGSWPNANPYYTVNSIEKAEILSPTFAADMSQDIVYQPWSGSQISVYDPTTGCWISQSCYPYQFKVIEYPSTWGVSKYGPNKFRNEKVRHISQSIGARFDDKERSTWEDPNSIAPDSNQIGLFADPNDFKNKDIVRYFGNYDFMEIIGAPSNQYSSSYDSLRLFRKEYAKARNESSGSHTLYGELMTLFKLYFNRSIFEAIKNLVPARSNTLTGVLIEPTILERPKYAIRPIFSEANVGSVFYADITASHYFRDSNTKLVRLSMSLDTGSSVVINASYASMPIRDYPVNYGGNYIPDATDKYGLGHFAGGILTNEELAGLILLPMANFDAKTLRITVGDEVEFTNRSAYADRYCWNFGDAPGVLTGLPYSPTHTYTTPGLYTVSLNAYADWGGFAGLTRSAYITVEALPPDPITVDFTAIPTVGNASLTVNFTKTTTNATDYSWWFGDNTTSTLENPSHTYTRAGLYTVTLYATRGTPVVAAASKIRVNYINVGNTPIPDDPPPYDGTGGGGCLLTGTKIRMADGSIKLIEDIQVGDMILGMEGRTDRVSKLLPNRFYKYFIINDRLKITCEHPVMVWRNGKVDMIPTAEMVIGDMMVKYDSSLEEMTSKVEVFEENPTFNFIAEREHMYVAEDIVVHNATGTHIVIHKR